jgi:hypothetical protein
MTMIVRPGETNYQSLRSLKVRDFLTLKPRPLKWLLALSKEASEPQTLKAYFAIRGGALRVKKITLRVIIINKQFSSLSPQGTYYL